MGRRAKYPLPVRYYIKATTNYWIAEPEGSWKWQFYKEHREAIQKIADLLLNAPTLRYHLIGPAIPCEAVAAPEAQLEQYEE